MKTPRIIKLLFIRVIQLLGNLTKGVLYLHLLIFPKQRFIIPAISRPLIQAKSTKKIPRIIWQTNYTNVVTLPMYLNYIWNRLLTPTFEYRYASDEVCELFIRENFNARTYQNYQKIKVGAGKADFWRILTLHKIGGIYLDMDAAFCWPPEFFIEAEDEDIFLQNKDSSITNYCLASAPCNPKIAQIIELINDNIETNPNDSVYSMTGPIAVDKIIRSSSAKIVKPTITCKQGLFTRKEFQYPDNLKGYWVKEEQEQTKASQNQR